MPGSIKQVNPNQQSAGSPSVEQQFPNAAAEAQPEVGDGLSAGLATVTAVGAATAAAVGNAAGAATAVGRPPVAGAAAAGAFYAPLHGDGFGPLIAGRKRERLLWNFFGIRRSV